MKTRFYPRLLCLLLLCGVTEVTADGGTNGSGGVNADRHLKQPYVVLVSLDGFRWDYPDRFELPAIRSVIDNGFRAERLLPVFPTLTFPNHYAIATGLYPDKHGIVGNYFRAPDLDSWYALSQRETVENGRFYAGEPVWVTAERQGMVTAAFFFVGSEADIGGVRPTHWRPFSKDVPGDERVDQVLAWLQAPPRERPHLLLLYFEHVDDHSHWSGVGSDKAVDAAARVDALIERLVNGIDELAHGDQVNLIVVSDHGQSSYRPDAAPLVLTEHIDIDGIRIVGRGSYSFLYYDDPDINRITADRDRLRAAWDGGRILRPEDAPSAWQVGSNPRWPDLMVLPDPGRMVVAEHTQVSRLNPGAHGWPPEFADMHGVLFGRGPAFVPGSRIESARVIDIQPLVLDILGLDAPATTDGRLEVFTPVRASD